jgi:hypothetical protein
LKPTKMILGLTLALAFGGPGASQRACLHPFPLVCGGAQTQVQYLDIGLNIDASIDESAHGVKLNTQVEQSSIAEEKSGLGTQDPIVRQAKLEGTSILTAGKPLILGSMDIRGTARRLDIEVVMEHVAQ